MNIYTEIIRIFHAFVKVSQGFSKFCAIRMLYMLYAPENWSFLTSPLFLHRKTPGAVAPGVFVRLSDKLCIKPFHQTPNSSLAAWL